MKNIINFLLIVITLSIPIISVKAETLSNRLKGRILLQVEDRGQAWYVEPKSGERYYMADGNEAYDIMRNLGIGITNKDLDKFKASKSLAQKSSGKIFLQVQASGEAYYVDFNGNLHYLKDGLAAYEIMRSLGLGITNSNLDYIKISSFTKSSIPEEDKFQNFKKLIIDDKPIVKPLTTAELFKENKKYVVSVMCETRDGYSFGSGVVIGKSYSNKLLVLTNYHVTSGFYSQGGQPPCIVSFQSLSPHFASPTMFKAYASQETMEIEDWSLLEIDGQVSAENIDINGNSIFAPELSVVDTYKTLPRICSQDELSAGMDIVALGFPAIGGGSLKGAPVLSLTATEGIISSEPDIWNHYFVSSAKIDHGNSGGGAFLKTNGCLAGVPTFVSVGEIESLARFINMANLKVKYKEMFDYIQR